MEFSHHFWGMHPFWWLFWIIMLAALLMWGSPLRRTTPLEAPHEVLRRRYAAGEITEEEYRHRLATLTGTSAPRSDTTTSPSEAPPSSTTARPSEHHG